MYFSSNEENRVGDDKSDLSNAPYFNAKFDFDDKYGVNSNTQGVKEPIGLRNRVGSSVQLRLVLKDKELFERGGVEEHEGMGRKDLETHIRRLNLIARRHCANMCYRTSSDRSDTTNDFFYTPIVEKSLVISPKRQSRESWDDDDDFVTAFFTKSAIV